VSARFRFVAVWTVVIGLALTFVAWSNRSQATHETVGTNVADACPITPFSPDLPPDSHAAGFSPTWFRSLDGGIWVAVNGRWRAGRQKVLWSTTDVVTDVLSVRGQRIDDDSPPLVVNLAGERGAIIPSGLDFPSAGCWQIDAEAGASHLQFVVYVYPRAYRPIPGSCVDLADTVKNSNGVIVGTVEASTVDGQPGFTWQTVRVDQTLAGNVVPTGERLDVLQDVGFETPIDRGRRYVLFLTSVPGQPWRIMCPQRSLAEVQGDLLVSLRQPQTTDPLWSAGTVDELALELADQNPADRGQASLVSPGDA
jgi:hypothetical protein